MKSAELQSHPTVRELARIQTALDLRDIPFAEQLGMRYHGANWGKIKAGTFTGNLTSAVTHLSAVLDGYLRSTSGTGAIESGTVLLDHVTQFLDAIDIARANDDEHRLVVVSGPRGAGKTRVLSLTAQRHNAIIISAMPSWGGAYLGFLNQFAEALGIPTARSAAEAERNIIQHVNNGIGMILLDEFNHFSAAGINFLKALINQTRVVIGVATVPYHLQRMASDRSTAQESVQFLRRAVAIVHIPTLTTRTIIQLAGAIRPGLDVAKHASAIAQAANQGDRLDAACAILEDAASTDDIPQSIARHTFAKRINPAA